MATTIAGGWAPYLIPIIKVVIKLGFAGVETANDITKIKQGYGVVIVKKTDTWATVPYMGDNTKKKYMTLDYSEYLRFSLIYLIWQKKRQAFSEGSQTVFRPISRT